MNKKKIIFISAVVITAGLVVYFYLSHFYFGGDERKIYTAEDFPNALGYMSADILEQSLIDLNKQYEKLAGDDHVYIRWINIGLLKKRLHDYPGAEKAWQMAIAINADQYLAYGNLADFYLFDVGDYQKAEEYFAIALKMRPDHFGYRVGLCSLYRYNMTEKAHHIEDIMLRGIEIMPAEAAEYYMYLADYFYSEGDDTAKSKEYSQKALEFDPNLKDQLPDYTP